MSLVEQHPSSYTEYSAPSRSYDLSSPPPTDQRLELENRKESIFNYYSIDNEVDFIRSNESISPEQKQYYVKENVLRFLSEFAGKVPYSKITYILREDGLYYADLRVMDTYAKTAVLAGAGSREMAEGIGFEQAQEYLLRGEHDRVSWVSPPKIANYGFVFHFTKEPGFNQQLQGQRVTEYILRYPEKMNDTTNSTAIYRSIGGDRLPDANAFIQRPLATGELTNLLTSVGIDEATIKKSERFEKEIEKLLPWIEQYTKLIFNLSHLTKGEQPYLLSKLKAEQFLAAIYNRATDIKNTLDTLQGGLGYIPELPTIDMSDPMVVAHYANERTAEVQGGGSCPVASNGSNDSPFVTHNDIYSKLQQGLPPEKTLTDEKKGTCDACGGEADGHYHCNGCGKSYADETNVTNRTPKCTQCGETFGC